MQENQFLGTVNRERRIKRLLFIAFHHSDVKVLHKNILLLIYFLKTTKIEFLKKHKNHPGLLSRNLVINILKHKQCISEKMAKRSSPNKSFSSFSETSALG